MVAEQTQELRETQFQLVQQEKLALLGQLAAGIAHELRNPLGVITNSTYLLQLLLTNPDEMVSEHLALINDRVYEAEKIISALLKLSYTHVAEPAVTDLAGLTAEVLFEQPPPDNVTVSSLIDPNLPSAWIDRQQIKQVLVNLVTNAYQAMPNGGALSISARVVSRGELSSGAREQGSKAESSLTTPHNYVALSLTDTGAGISPETQAKIFEPLYTTKARGIGLGLAISRNLVEINGGNIEVESVEGKGSVFTLILPALEEVPS
jgi:signal transduction histidine kinase